MTERNDALLSICRVDDQERVVLCERKRLALDFCSSGAQIDKNSQRKIRRLVLVPADFLLREVRFKLSMPVGPIWRTVVINHDQWSLIFAIEPHTKRTGRDGKSAETDDATNVGRRVEGDDASERYEEQSLDASL